MNSLSKCLSKVGKTTIGRTIIASPSLPSRFVHGAAGTVKKQISSRAIAYGTVGTAMVGTGVTLSYAKYHPQFRENLKDHIRVTDDVIKFLWQEENTYAESVTKWRNKNKKTDE